MALCACGGRVDGAQRSGEGEDTSVRPGDATPHGVCAREPWLVFTATGRPPGAPSPGTTAWLAATRADGSERHLLAPTMATQSSNASWDAAGSSLLYAAFDGSYALRRLRLTENDGLLFAHPHSVASVSDPVASPDGQLVAFRDWVSLATVRSDGSGENILLDPDACGTCVPIGFSADSSAVYVATTYGVDTVSTRGGGRTPVLTIAPSGPARQWSRPALSPDRTRLAMQLTCPTAAGVAATTLRILDLRTPRFETAAALCDGSTASTIVATTHLSTYAAWGPDDRIAYDDEGALWVATGGSPRALTADAREWKASQPLWVSGCAPLPSGPAL